MRSLDKATRNNKLRRHARAGQQAAPRALAGTDRVHGSGPKTPAAPCGMFDAPLRALPSRFGGVFFSINMNASQSNGVRGGYNAPAVFGGGNCVCGCVDSGSERTR